MRAGLLFVGAFCMIGGVFLDLTIFGAIVGIPIGIIGFLIFIFGLFGKEKITIVKEEKKGNESNLDVLKKRYANGEITKEEYEEMKKELMN